MSPKKFTSIVFIILGSAFMTTSCEENSAGVKPATPTGSNKSGARILNYTFDGTEGGAIPLSTASSWISNYANQNAKAVKSHFFGSSALQNILASNGCVGIRIYYSVDNNGSKQLLLIGADRNGADLLTSALMGKTSSADLAGADSTDLSNMNGELIPSITGKEWMLNYSSKNPSGIIAHFFGYEIVNQILNQKGCVGMRLYYALNDSGVQQVLLIGVDSNGGNILPSLTGGRTTDGGGTVGDMSFPCPSYCG